MKRSRINDEKQNDSKECKIIDTINVQQPKSIIQTPCGKFLIGVEKNSIFRYCLKTKQKFRIAGSVEQWGHQNGHRDESSFCVPRGLILSKDSKILFVADWGNYIIRTISVETGVTTTFSGQVKKCELVDGLRKNASFTYPKTLKLSPDGNTLYVADFEWLRTICIETGQIDTINTFKSKIHDFTFSPDGKHVIICILNKVLKYNIETGKSELVLKAKGLKECGISKDGQLLFILHKLKSFIKVVNNVTNQVIDTITLHFKTDNNMTISTNGKQLYIGNYFKIQVLDISKYCANFKTFIQLQLFKHSFLPRSVIKRCLI